MDRDELLKEITTEDVKKIMKDLGSNEPIPDKQGRELRQLRELREKSLLRFIEQIAISLANPDERAAEIMQVVVALVREHRPGQ